PENVEEIGKVSGSGEKRTVILDDHPAVRFDYRVVGEGGSLADGKRLMAELESDVLLVDRPFVVPRRRGRQGEASLVSWKRDGCLEDSEIAGGAMKPGKRALFIIVLSLVVMLATQIKVEANESYVGSYSWQMSLRIRMGWGFGSIWTEGPYDVTGRFSYSDSGEPLFSLSCPEGTPWGAFMASGSWSLNESGAVTSGPNAGSWVSVTRGPNGKITNISGFMYYYGDWDFIIVSIGAPWIGVPEETPATEPSVPDMAFGGSPGSGGYPKQPTPPTPPAPSKCPLTAWDQLSGHQSGNLGRIMVDDPVNIAFGNFFHSEVDLTLKGRHPLTLARCYNSLDTHKGAFGRGWSSPYGARLDINENEVLFVNSDGSRFRFQKQGAEYQAPAGCPLRLTFNSDTDFWVLTHPHGDEWTFDSQGRLLRLAKVCCGMGATDAVTCEYNPEGKLNKVSNPSGQNLNFTVDNAGHIIRVEDSTGRIFLYSYDQSDHLSVVTDPLGRTTAYEYDESGYLTRITQPGNVTTNITYGDHRVTSIAGPDGGISTFSWASETSTLTLTDPMGTFHIYQLTPDGFISTYAVPSQGLMASYTLDSTGALMRFVNTMGGEEVFTYSSGSLLIGHTDALGGNTSYEYHPTFQQLTKKIDPLGRIWNYDWCIRGNLWSETDPA
ncbi:MAG: DUF6531 domain-containing protein, partial [Rectinemataceae bacterium]|nr:DUF6531 domain-containing protein [Rectinemataceae bacterium]